jgi:hypothetical protein
MKIDSVANNVIAFDSLLLGDSYGGLETRPVSISVYVCIRY